MRTLTTGSLFSSGGGWEIGAVRAGMRPMWGVELDQERAALWNASFAGSPGCMAGDVWDASIVARTTPVDILFTSPVCRDFSRSKSRVATGTADACRPTLGLATLPYVDRLNPPVIMLENVVDYAKAKPYLDLRDGIVDRGYRVLEATLNAADYGNPSSRLRLFAVFIREGSGIQFAWPTPTGRTAWDAALAKTLRRLPTASATGAMQRTADAWTRTGRSIRYPMLFVSQKQGVIDGTPDYFVPAGKPAPTMIVGHNALTGWRVMLSGTDIRRITGDAAAILNGFVVPGRFPINYGHGYSEYMVAEVAGDAVSPIMAEALIRGLRFPPP